MADLIAYAPIDMLDESHLGAGYNQSQIASTSQGGGYDRKGFMTETTTLTSGLVNITKYKSDMKSINSTYQYERELKGRLKVSDFKIYYPDWIAIYGSNATYSDLPSFSAVNIEENSSRTFPGLEVEIFAKILSSSDNITGSSGNDFLYAFRGDDLISPQAGEDFIHGGAGRDTMKVMGKRSQFQIAKSIDFTGIQFKMASSQGNYYPVYMGSLENAFRLTGPSGTKTMIDVEKVQFDDGTYDLTSGAFDTNTSPRGSSGKGSNGNRNSKKKKGRKD